MFTWDENYSVGHSAIDFQHKKLFEIGAQLELLVVNFNNLEKQDSVLEVYNSLLDYVKLHFSAEEKILKSINYSNYDEHILKHKLFVDKLHALDFSLDQEDVGSYLFEMLQLVANWIFEHIKGEDFAYKYELQKFV